MDDPKVLERMRADWNSRAGEDANYYVAFGRREQDDEEFFSTAAPTVGLLESELKRLRGRERALEIGCGPGRLMRPMSRHFTEIHGVDVSDEMVRLASERLRHTPNAHPHCTSGSDLRQFAAASFDFVYSYAVFQHIPSRDVVMQYLREARRVLKPGGILRCQLNGLPAHARQYDTWSGVRISPEEIREFARVEDLDLLALEQVWTQYMWMTARKPTGAPASTETARIRNINNALTGEAVTPSTGPLAAIAVMVEKAAPEWNLNELAVVADGLACRLTFIGEPAADGVSQVNAFLPEGVRTGVAPVELRWRGQAVCAPEWIRIIPAGPAVPHVASITDGVNLLAGTRIAAGIVKVTMLEVARAEDFRATVDGVAVSGIDSFRTDPVAQRYEFNFPLPAGIAAGPHEVRIALGRRELGPLAIEVA